MKKLLLNRGADAEAKDQQGLRAKDLDSGSPKSIGSSPKVDKAATKKKKKKSKKTKV